MRAAPLSETAAEPPPMSRLSAASEPEPSGLPRMAMSPEPPMPLQLFVPPDMTLLSCAEIPK